MECYVVCFSYVVDEINQINFSNGENCENELIKFIFHVIYIYINFTEK